MLSLSICGRCPNIHSMFRDLPLLTVSGFFWMEIDNDRDSEACNELLKPHRSYNSGHPYGVSL